MGRAIKRCGPKGYNVVCDCVFRVYTCTACQRVLVCWSICAHTLGGAGVGGSALLSIMLSTFPAVCDSAVVAMVFVT